MQNVKVQEKEVVGQALNCVENLLFREEIDIDKYELLVRVIDLLGVGNAYDLGGGLAIILIDKEKSA